MKSVKGTFLFIFGAMALSSSAMARVNCLGTDLEGVDNVYELDEGTQVSGPANAFGFTKIKEYEFNSEDSNTRRHELAEVLIGSTNGSPSDYTCSKMSLKRYLKNSAEYWVLRSEEDDCDGGNTIGLVMKVVPSANSRDADVNIFASIGDGDIYCSGNPDLTPIQILAYRFVKLIRK